MKEYKCLSKQIYSFNKYQIVPIRDEDRYNIMQWRNEQIYHLRQTKLLDKESQDVYFNNIVSKLFEKENPDQILFSYLENEKCIGYGGLVHINWVDKNAEISFLINISEEIGFNTHWSIFLKLIELAAFDDLKIHKIYTFAFDLRPQLYQVLEQNGFYKEAILKDHCFFDEKFIDVVVHSKLNIR
jgi:RimJ/RimL family protein N-acetyltransferase